MGQVFFPVVPVLVSFGFKLRIMMMAIGVVFCIGGLLAGSTVVAVIGITLAAGSLFVPTAPTEDERRDYDASTKHLRAAKEAWVDTFKCNSCGHKLVPSEANAA
jgi:hypothetical protein